VFSLNARERLYFLFNLLRYDRDLICPLILQLSTSCPQRKRDVRKIFPEVYKEHLVGLRNYSGTVRSRRQLDAALERIAHWRRAEKYMEHVVDPRISWLVDLEVCMLEDDQVSLTDSGVAFADWLTRFSRSNLLVITEEFLRHRFFKAIAPIVERNDGWSRSERPQEEVLIELLRTYCDFVREHTSPLVPNRIVASTLFRYAGISLFTELPQILLTF
jgi:hypothetical protein